MSLLLLTSSRRVSFMHVYFIYLLKVHGFGKTSFYVILHIIVYIVGMGISNGNHADKKYSKCCLSQNRGLLSSFR